MASGNQPRLPSEVFHLDVKKSCGIVKIDMLMEETRLPLKILRLSARSLFIFHGIMSDGISIIYIYGLSLSNILS